MIACKWLTDFNFCSGARLPVNDKMYLIQVKFTLQE